MPLLIVSSRTLFRTLRLWAQVKTTDSTTNCLHHPIEVRHGVSSEIRLWSLVLTSWWLMGPRIQWITMLETDTRIIKTKFLRTFATKNQEPYILIRKHLRLTDFRPCLAILGQEKDPSEFLRQALFINHLGCCHVRLIMIHAYGSGEFSKQSSKNFFQSCS